MFNNLGKNILNKITKNLNPLAKTFTIGNNILFEVELLSFKNAFFALSLKGILWSK